MVAATSSRPRPLALWVTPVSEPGGVARHVLDTVRAGIPGFRLAVLCPPGPLAEQLRADGAAVLTGPFGPGACDATAGGALRGSARAAVASAATLRHTVRTLRPAVVHSHLAFADIVCAAVLRGAAPHRPEARTRSGRSPLLVSTEHGIAGDASLYHAADRTARMRAAVHTRRLRRTDAVIAVSHATARVMRERWDARDVVVVPNGVDRPERAVARRPALDSPRVLSLSRLAPEKNLGALIDSIALLRESHPSAHLTLAGEGGERDRLRAHVERAGLTECVDFPGLLDAREAMAQHDVVVQLSSWENCSYTLLDAAAAGLGVVATDVGGNPEILPQRCLVPVRRTGSAAAVRDAIVEQADPASAPELPLGWPTTEEMACAIADLYERQIQS